MENLWLVLVNNTELMTAIIAGVVFVIDYIIKKTNNKVDDAIWSKIKNPIVNMFKEFVESKRVKKETKEDFKK